MDPAQRSRWIQLGTLSVVLAAVLYFVLLPSLRGPAVPAGSRPAAAAGRAAAKPGARAIDVRLDALGRPIAPEETTGARRNPFRMGAATPAPSPEGTLAARMPPRTATPAPPIGPPPAPPVPPIPYRFIGVLSGVPGHGRIAVLTDGRSVVHGRINEIIEGRYRIIAIGEESLQIEHADGRGRQTIRLLGQ